ncbi:glycosyltransferase family 2 protein [Maritimibacter dapengensis]|uniref:Glycosyltransferase family 2 protein n=1 Tax=Maritimibacter dapengensis TaxID=2836868 RepID=A0ABS6SXL9_9RHOB|nr:glycosyltransferase family 2 protein [Maritimibacter dapengensis]MBV7377708.1 glycosyltransferase family 2 protein [Maritimibacter dapengensis]
MSWGIVATVDEPAPLIIAFAGWHLAQGASEIHLYFDRPNPEAEAVVASLPGVHVTTCDPAYWQRAHGGNRRNRQTGRQIQNAEHARARSAVTWLLHSDADEFVTDGAQIGAAIRDVDPETHVIRLRVMERAERRDTMSAHIFDGVFRRRDWDYWKHGERYFGRWAKFLGYGLSGHLVGKVMLRAGPRFRHDIHDARDVPGGTVLESEVKLDDALLHFDGLTRRHYVMKMLRRVDQAHFMNPQGPDGSFRHRQIMFLKANAEAPQRVAMFYDGVKKLGPNQIDALNALGLLSETPFDPRPALQGLGIDVDLSPAAFDRALASREPEVMARYATLFAGLDETGAGSDPTPA